MRRREFITVLGGTVATWPLAALAQPTDRMRRLGVLTILDNAEAKIRIGPFLQELEQLGWAGGRNLLIDMRVGAGSVDATRKYTAELVTLTPDIIIAVGNASTEFSLQATRTVPIVFMLVADPLGAGYVDDLARPSGNATGFMLFEYSLSGKWLEQLKQIAPNVKRAGVIRDPGIGSGSGQFAVIQTVAASLGLEVRAIDVRDPAGMERAVAALAGSADAGLIVTASPLSAVHRDLIISLAARHKLPAVYFERAFVTAGGLISYGPNFNDEARRAANYADRILKGEKPANLPVQAPTKYELVINLKTAKTLGLSVPPTQLTRADDIIE